MENTSSDKVVRVEKSDSIKELAAALSAFQGQVETVAKDSVNPFFKSKYAGLESIVKTIREPLAKNGLAVTQWPISEGELCTILTHKSGEWIMGTFKMRPKDNTPQGIGSAMTYARRYALSAVLSVATGEGEDDGNAASQEPKTRTVRHIQHQDYQGNEVEPVVQMDEEPTRPTPEVIVTPAILKTQIQKHLIELGYKGKTKKEIQDYVADVTKMDLSKEENYEEIEARLSILASEKFN